MRPRPWRLHRAQPQIAMQPIAYRGCVHRRSRLHHKKQTTHMPAPWHGLARRHTALPRATAHDTTHATTRHCDSARSPTLVHNISITVHAPGRAAYPIAQLGPCAGWEPCAARRWATGGIYISGTRDDTITIGARGRATSKPTHRRVFVRAGRASEASDGR